MPTLPALNSLKVFEAAVRCGSFAQAADELHLTPSAISHQIKLLEERLGVRLFHRVRRAVIATDAGQRYYEEVRAAFRRIAVATAELTDSIKNDRLTIYSSPSFAAQWLMPRLSHFVATHPELDVVFSVAPPPFDLKANDCDIGIQYAQDDGDVVQLIPLPPELIVPMCSPDFLDGARRIRRPEDLAVHALIHSDRCLVRWRQWLELHPGLVLDLDRGLHFDRSFMSISAAVQGLGVCLESTLLAHGELVSGRLVKPLGDDGIEITGHRVVCLPDKRMLPKVLAFADWLSDALSTKQHADVKSAHASDAIDEGKKRSSQSLPRTGPRGGDLGGSDARRSSTPRRHRRVKKG